MLHIGNVVAIFDFFSMDYPMIFLDHSYSTG